MEDVGQIEQWLQRSLLKEYAQEEEVMLTITVPISADSAEFRIGFEMRGVRSRKWIAISTGLAVWSRRELASAALHIESVLACCVEMVQGSPVRRD